ncbi:MAG: MATE family efflux transporter [Prevotellaceae bacterium]|nr:MATE family efflux transporter [Prevotella sp.]MDD7256957.1 MATE family efflux transporter [Prevotellaceae bacterium]MDY6131396.1 MATE family efflux transporter [Prevotella sp.]
MISKKRTDALLAMIRKKQEMTGRQKFNLIVWLAIPSVLAQVTSVLMFYIDAAMVGALGAEASASIGLVESTTWLFGSLTGAAAMGFSVQAAHFIGANDFERARQVFVQGLMATGILTVFLTAVCLAIADPLPHWLGGGSDITRNASLYFAIYSMALPIFQFGVLSSSMLKSSGNMRVPSFISLLMCLLDVVFNFLLIFPTRTLTLWGIDFQMPGAGMGVAGAALGTALAYLVTGILLIRAAVFKSPEISLRYRQLSLKPQWGYLHNALKISGPMAAQHIMMGGAQIVSTMIVAPLGNFAIAANTFAITAESLCYMPGIGIGEAATTLVGQSNGAGRYALCRSFAYKTVFLGMAVMAMMGIVMYIAAPDMIGIMSPVEEIRRLGTSALRIEAFAEPMFAAAIVCYSIFVGAGDTLIPACMNLGSMWLVRLTLAASLAPKYGLNGVWFAMAVELTFRGSIFLVRLFRGKWMKMRGLPTD